MKEDSPRMFRPVCLGDDTPFELQLLVKGSARSPRRKKQIDTRKKISCMYFARRQAFREAIVKAVMASGGEERISSADVPFDDERTISRYYFYVAHGMDLNLTEPMDSSWLDSILAKIQLPHSTPERLRRQEGARRLLAREVREQYLQAVRKAVVDFALQDPFDADVRDVVAAARERDSAARRELRETSATWRDGYEAARYAIARDLHILNPCHVAASRLWHTRPYQNLRLLNVAELPEKMELMEFRTLVLRNIEKTRDFLKNEWLSAIQSLLVKCDRRNQMPKPRERRRNRSFYNSLAVVMGNQLQSLCIRSIEDYTSLICDPEANLGFVIRVLYERDEGFLFRPSFSQFEDVVLELADAVARGCDDIPRVEGELYLDFKSSEVLKPIIPVEIVNEAKWKVLVQLYGQRESPYRQLRDFDPYLYLVDGTAREEADRLKDPGEQFVEMVDAVGRLDVASRHVPCEVLEEARLGLYVVRRGNVVAVMVSSARRRRDQLLDRVQAAYDDMRDRLVEECRSIKERASSEPDSVEELLALIEFVHGLEASVLNEVGERIVEYLRLFLFLTEYRELPEPDLVLNRRLLQWHRRMEAVVDRHRDMVERKTQEFSDAFFA